MDSYYIDIVYCFPKRIFTLKMLIVRVEGPSMIKAILVRNEFNEKTLDTWDIFINGVEYT